MRYLSIILISGILIFGILSCGGFKTSFLSKAEVEFREAEPASDLAARKVKRAQCTEALAYAPDLDHMDHFPKRYIRLSFHFMNSVDGTQNFSEERGVAVAKDLIYHFNKKILENKPMTLPLGNETPVLPFNYQFELTPADRNDPNDDGIYFHYDDDLYYFIKNGKYRNNYNTTVIKKYGIKTDSIINVFMMPHHPDSVASKSYKTTKNGIALGTDVKMAGIFERGDQGYKYAGMFNHEIGHVFSLRHTWAYDDGCPDTPKHKNCWNYTDSGPCKTEVSNNYMDSNSMQSAMTPCQIGRMHYQMSLINSKARKVLRPTWCTLNPKKTVTIAQDFVWEGAKDLEGHLIIKSGAQLTLKCRLSMPENSRIVLEAGAKLILENGYIHNSCGKEWEGIEIQSQGSKKGEVIFIGEEARLENIQYF